MPNLFADIPHDLPREIFHTILSRQKLRIERIISQGQASPEDFWCDQNEHEFVVLLQGAARLRFEEGEIEMKPGDFIDIQAHQRHRVEWTDPNQPTIWLAISYSE